MVTVNVVVVILVICSCPVYGDQDKQAPENTAFDNPKRKLTPIRELVKKQGYPIDGYTVESEGGYVVTVYRIRHGKDGHGTNKVPVFLQHGILDSSAGYLAYSTSIAYYLADRGYDVWLGNARGSLYSRKHKSLNPDTDPKYWDFDFHEMGDSDLPAILKTVREVSGVDKVNYIGMSMGSTMFLVMATLHPQLLDWLDCVMLLAPVGRPVHMEMLRGPKYYVNWFFFNSIHFLGVREFMSHKELPAVTFHKLCNSRSWTGKICSRVLHSVSPSQKDIYDFEKAKDTIQYFPAGSTVKTYKHYLQIASSGRFQQYDYGAKKNKLVYGRESSPPEYDLRKINKRLYLLAGGLDNIATIEDIEWLQQKLPDAVLITKPFEHFSHRDFLFGVNLQETLYKTVEQIFLDYKSYKKDKGA